MVNGRIRRIHPSTWVDKKVHLLSDSEALAFIALWSRCVDDQGRGVCDAVELSLMVPRFKSDAWERYLRKYSTLNLIQVYEFDGTTYLAIPRFERYQKVRYPTPSVLPPPHGNDEADVKPADRRFARRKKVVDMATETIPYRGIYDLWNAVCGKDCPNVKFSDTDERLLIVKRVWEKHKSRQELAWWKHLFERVRMSDFLSGRNDGQTFRAPFKWVLQEDKMSNILEGNYDNPKSKRMRNEGTIREFLEGADETNSPG